MSRHGNRITLVATSPTKPDLDWRVMAAKTRVAFVSTLTALRFALETAIEDDVLDIERVVIDRAGNAEEFLDLLARIPGEFLGDVMLVRDNGSGYLSAMGRGGDRVLYALAPRDVRFYLEAHDLVTGRGVLYEERKIA
jgi:hypothetical protein